MISLLLIFVNIESKVESKFQLLLLVPLWGFLVGFFFAYIQLFIHEAGHFNIHPNKRINDVLANIFIGLLIGANIKEYRDVHWKHHQRLGHSNDTENSYFNNLSFGFIFRMLTGLYVITVLKSRKKLNKDKKLGTTNYNKNVNVLLGIILHAGIIFLLYTFSAIYAILVWVIAVIVFFPFFSTVRQLIEHRDADAENNINFFKQDHGTVTRLFKDTFFSKLFGGAGFSRHMLHHWDPSISYTRLVEVESFLENTKGCGKIIEDSRTTYSSIFMKLLSNGSKRK